MIASLSTIFTLDLICSSVLKILRFLTLAVQKGVFDDYVAKCICLKITIQMPHRLSTKGYVRKRAVLNH